MNGIQSLSYLKPIALCAAFLSASAAFANTPDCVSLNANIKQMATFEQQGTYRFTQGEVQRIKFDFAANLPYSDYLRAARAHIDAQNPKASMPCPIQTPTSQLLYGDKTLQVADLIAPFELQAKNAQGAVLLIHGLTDSPYLFHDLAKAYLAQGLTVRTLLLPGHATAPDALVDIDEADWRIAAEYAIKRMLNDFDKVYLGGFSTGGALVVDYLNTHKLSEQAQHKLKGVMLYSPASEAKAGNAWLAKYVSWFKDYLDEAADVDFAKYESFPTNAGAQVHALMNRIAPSRLSNLPNTPLFVVASEVDQTINTEATVNLVQHWHQNNGAAKAQDVFVYYGNKAQITSLPSSLNTLTKHACGGHSYCNSVLDVAHTSPTNAPANPHYGWQGNYRNCEHLKGSLLFKDCKTSNDVTLGEITEANLQKEPNMQRLTFNPYYEQMTEQLGLFIKKTL